MAVAKAQGQGGFSAIHIWLVGFVGLWLTATVLLVILYLDQDKKDSAVAEMRDQLAKVISSEGRKLPEFTQASPSRGSTMVDLLESARTECLTMAAGTGASDVPALRAQLDAQLMKIRASRFVKNPDLFEGVAYNEALTSLFELFKQSSEALEETRSGLDTMTEQMTQLRADQKEQQEAFDKKSQEMKEKLASFDKSNAESLQTHGEQVDAFSQQVEKIKQQCSDDIQAQRSANARMGRDYEDLLARYQQLKEKLGQSQVAPLPLATARRMDGTILTATAGEDVVYIDLGARDHLTLGLEFAVYDALEGIPEDGRAKARIEVVRIDEETAVCRIDQRLRHEMVVAGDIIANPVYDKHRTIRFYVMGQFDTNNDGRPDPDGQDLVRALIKKWGGEVEAALTAQVDFVVLGSAPRKPVRSSEYDANADARYQQRMRAFEHYQGTLKTADALAVPRLTQSVLINFLGYDSAQVTDFGAVAESPF